MNQKAEFTDLQKWLSNVYESMLDFQENFKNHGIDSFSPADYCFIVKHASSLTAEIYEFLAHVNKLQSIRLY